MDKVLRKDYHSLFKHDQLINERHVLIFLFSSILIHISRTVPLGEDTNQGEAHILVQ